MLWMQATQWSGNGFRARAADMLERDINLAA